MDVTEALEAHKNKFKTIEVERLLPVDFDLALLAAYDQNPIEDSSFSGKKENVDAFLKEYTRGGAQLLINEIFKLPVEANDLGVVAKLPDQKTVIPREKPLPKAKPLTRWEKFAKAKGIQNKKRSRMVYDEATGEYKPRYGYKGINDDQGDWLIEVPDKADPTEDQFAARKTAKKERIAKNQAQQRRNMEEAAAITEGKHPRDVRKKELEREIRLSKTSTASVGKFDKKLEHEPKVKGVKRKFAPAISDVKKEKESSLNILQRVVGNEDVLNVNKAIKKSRK
ncbi:RRS1-domain-containing protein [Basidiobolus meristosporus CBS 931.73]|uniref:Ribosome biogenesis regulatory protein n=1 Tax=Basidiobolus meristosporus CBS 931.73 TaxID=1314790 RepID=A0A1Y1YJK5_9FUNG|nr:RRS1-domain-containing protein [Basidiobolus meristosporus CBS 931.73]|eukprot:ORX98152.1 RRS1-domain-containing protein [Basidiobolus meristosporus CBS 931.73]